MSTEPSSHPPRALVIAAFATIYIVWGSTYLAIRVAVETLPPFLMAGCRFLVAGTALFTWLWLRGVALPDKIHWRNAAITGSLLLTGGNGLVVWSEQTVPSNLAALLIALTPVWFALIDWLRPSGLRPRTQTVVGILVGLSGVVLLVSGPDTALHNSGLNLSGALALALAGLLWAGGSLFSRHSAHPRSPWMNAAAQMMCGGAGLMLLAVLTGEPGRVNKSHVSGQSLAALFYLIVFGSWIAYSAYIWLLKASTPARVATYAYVNPVIAVFLGRFILGELLNARAIWAAMVIVAGVIVTTLPRRP